MDLQRQRKGKGKETSDGGFYFSYFPSIGVLWFGVQVGGHFVWSWYSLLRRYFDGLDTSYFYSPFLSLSLT